MKFTLVKREIENPEYGKEIVIEKKYKLHKDQWNNRLWVFNPQDPVFLKLDAQMKAKGLWK